MTPELRPIEKRRVEPHVLMSRRDQEALAGWQAEVGERFEATIP